MESSPVVGISTLGDSVDYVRTSNTLTFVSRGLKESLRRSDRVFEILDLCTCVPLARVSI